MKEMWELVCEYLRLFLAFYINFVMLLREQQLLLKGPVIVCAGMP